MINPEICTWCMSALTSPAAWLDLGCPDTIKQRDAHHGSLADRVALLDQALTAGWPAQIDGQRITRPVTTWHGDPVCAAHLPELVYAELAPKAARARVYGPRSW